MEGVTLGMNYGLRRLRQLGVKPREIRVTGGGAKSKLWRQIMADVFDAEVITVKVSEGAAYGAALQAYYSNGAPADWMQRFISPYATSHPWEDWAETWAHYLHMMDTLETAWSFGIRINAVEVEEEAGIRANLAQDPYEIRSFDRIIKSWLPLCFAVNSLNRSMGHGDFYPFVLSAPVVEKLRFIHGVCGG